MNSLSRDKLKQKALEYKFSLKDLPKYSNHLGRSKLSEKLKFSALGKKIPNLEERQKKLEKESYIRKMYIKYKNTDWSLTPLY